MDYDNTKKLLQGYDSTENPVVAVSDGVIVFINRAAKALCDRNYVGKATANMLGEELAELAERKEITGEVRECELFDLPYSLEFIQSEPALYIFKSSRSKPINAMRELMAFANKLRGPVTEVFQCHELVAENLEDDDPVSKKQCVKYLGLIEKSCYELMRILNRVESFNNVGKEILHSYKTGDLVQVVSGVVDDVRDIFAQMEISLSFSSELDNAITLIDEDLIKDMMLSLLSNAASASKAGDRSVTVSIGRGSTPDMYEIVVADSGTGIAPYKLDSILSPSIDPEFPVTPGLGLAIAWEIANQHGGTMRMQSTSTGTRVAVTIAIRKGGALKVSSPIFIYSGISKELIEFAPNLPHDFFHKHHEQMLEKQSAAMQAMHKRPTNHIVPPRKK